MRVIKITMGEPNVKAVAASLESDAFRAALAEACATEGPLWILVDRRPVAVGAEPIDASANEEKTAA